MHDVVAGADSRSEEQGQDQDFGESLTRDGQERDS